MSFRLEIARPDDAPRITQIHMDAFGSNALIRAIHATDPELSELRKAVEMKALADMEDSKTTVLVVRHVNIITSERSLGASTEEGNTRSESRDIVGFAKWIHSYHPDDKYTPPSWTLPKTTDWKILHPWIAEVQKVEEQIIGSTPRFELTYLAVNVEWAKKGLGTLMVQWALDQCEAEGYPAYVESTVESLPFYEKLGFKVAGRISMDLREVVHDDSVGLYEEVGCIYTPESKAGLLDPDASKRSL